MLGSERHPGHAPCRRYRPNSRDLSKRHACPAEDAHWWAANSPSGPSARHGQRRRAGGRRRRDEHATADRGEAEARRGRVAKMSKAAHANDWRAHLDLAHAAPRCGAKRRDGASCRQPAMRNGRCRMHGGKSTGPRTPEGLERSRRANWKHGFYSAKAKAARREARESLSLLRTLLALRF